MVPAPVCRESAPGTAFGGMPLAGRSRRGPPRTGAAERGRALKARWLVAAGLFTLVVVPAAEARNFHVAGGIQYVTQGGIEKKKGNLADATRIYGKAIAQLTQGLEEDPKDLEAWDYLGIAYAELDSAAKAGSAFGSGIDKICALGDEKKKLCERIRSNREYYWVIYFNKAIAAYQKATAGLGEGKEPEASAVQPAIDAMSQAVAVNPGNPKAYCNLAAFQANAKQKDQALATIQTGLEKAPGDSCLMQRKEQLSFASANEAVQTGNFGPAIAAYEKQLAANPNDAGMAQSVGELYFKQGTQQEESAGKEADATKKTELSTQAKTSFTGAAKWFGKYHEAKPEDENGTYNYTIALLRSGNASEGAKMAQGLLTVKGDSPEYHSLMASAYRDLKVDDAAQGHALVTRVLKDGTKEADAAGAAQKAAAQYGATSAPAKVLKEMGPPDEVRGLTIGDYPVETWLWLGKKHATLFSKGKQVTEVDWTAVASAAKPAPTAKAQTKKSR